MTQRKQPGESWESLIERQVREAREQGELDGLAGAGRPLASADVPYRPDWWVKQWMRREQVSDLPPSLQIRARAERELDRLFALEQEDEVRLGLVALDAEIRRVNASVTTGPATSVAPLDIEALVEAWRDRRRGSSRGGQEGGA